MQPILCQTKLGKPLLIREAEGTDARMALDYVSQVCQESDNLTFGPGEFQMTEAEEVDFLSRSQANPQSLYLLALVEGQLVGVLSFSAGQRPRTRHVGSFGVSVLKAYWNQGIAGKLIEVLLAWANASPHLKKINLCVRSDNARAIALYFRKGFEIEGLLKNEICIAGTYYDHYSMGLMLSGTH